MHKEQEGKKTILSQSLLVKMKSFYTTYFLMLLYFSHIQSPPLKNRTRAKSPKF